ncbi:hepatic lectin-like isoform X1 [Branchiostoma floridae x Branchiostoma japonicum]
MFIDRIRVSNRPAAATPPTYRSLITLFSNFQQGPTTFPQVAGYTVRAGDCRGNDIWSLTGSGMTLSQCASRCSSSSQCVAFQFSNGNCYPKTATCSSPITDNTRDTFYDKEAGSVPDGYVERGGSYYKLFRTTKKNQASAQETCEADGGNLVSIKTSSLNNFLLGLMPDRVNYWIGLNDKDSEGTWMWEDGSRLKSCDFTNWAPYEPNDNYGAYGGQDCIHLWAGSSFKWDDDECWKGKYFICQIGELESFLNFNLERWTSRLWNLW